MAEEKKATKATATGAGAVATPVTILWENILMVPIVGAIDSKRAQEIMETMLVKVLETEAKTIIMDIMGVAIIDSAVANHLIKITQATQLMGSQCIVSGMSPAIAQTLIHLGVDMSNVKTTTTLKDALSAAFEMTGLEVVAMKKAVAK